jgi:hypothetical protein
MGAKGIHINWWVATQTEEDVGLSTLKFIITIEA